MSTTKIDDVEYVVHSLAQTAVEKEKEFGDLDAVVGDGDLGYSLARGFEKVLVVTSAFHMRRARECFNKVGIPFDTLAVDFRASSTIDE